MSFPLRSFRLSTSFLVNLAAIFTILVSLLSTFKNPDLVHDTFFLGHAAAMNSDLSLYKDIYSIYGPLVSWMMALFTNIFGNFVVIGRIFGLIVHLFIVVLMWNFLKKYVAKRILKLILITYTLIGSGFSETNSPRWPFAFGVWPTALSIIQLLLILNVLQLLDKESTPEKRSNGLSTVLLSMGFGIGTLAFSRLQGIIFFIIFCLLTIYLGFRNYHLRKRAFLVLIPTLLGFSLPVALMLFNNTFYHFLDQFVFGSFRFANQHYNGKPFVNALLSNSFFFSICFALVAVIAIVAIIVFAKRLPPFFNYSFIIITAIITGLLVILSGHYRLPEDLNRSPKLWLIKWTYLIPSSFSFLCLIIFIVLTLNFVFQFKYRNEKTISILNLEGQVWLIGVVSLSMLYVNFAYVYSLIPIMVCVIGVLGFFQERGEFRSLSEYAGKVLIFFATLSLSVSAFSLTSKQSKFASREFIAMTHRSDYLSSWNSVATRVNMLLESKEASMFYCDLTIFRVYSPTSYRNDIQFYKLSPKSESEFVSRVNSRVSRVLVCNPSVHAALVSLLPDWDSLTFKIDERTTISVLSKKE